MTDDVWSPVTLADILDLKHGYAFPGRDIRDEPPGDILVTPGNFAVGGGFKSDKFKYFDGDVPEEYVLSENDLIVTMTDLSKQADTLGYSALVPKSKGFRFLHNQRIGKVLIRDASKVDKRFTSYLLRTAHYRNEILAGATGTTVKHTSPTRVLAYKTSIPPMAEQRAIAHILGTLDDKIDLNSRMNDTLQEIARTLYRSWFVDFDIVRAKSEGTASVLPRLISDLFPATFEETELGEIPRGWSIGSILSDARLMSGGTPKTDHKEYWGGPVHWASAKDVSQAKDSFLVATERTITPKGVQESTTQILPRFCSVVVARGATTGRMVLLGEAMAMNQTCYALVSNVATPFALHCRLREGIDALVHAAHGSVFDTITTRTFELSKTAIPPSVLQKTFEERVSPFFLRQLSNVHESRALAALRDALLPKLVSGEFRVKDAEKIAARAL